MSMLCFHYDEKGDLPVSSVLQVAFIVVPLVGLLIVAKDQLVEYFNQVWEELFSAGAGSQEES